MKTTHIVLAFLLVLSLLLVSCGQKAVDTTGTEDTSGVESPNQEETTAPSSETTPEVKSPTSESSPDLEFNNDIDEDTTGDDLDADLNGLNDLDNW